MVTASLLLVQLLTLLMATTAAPPPSELSVAAGIPSLVAETSALLYYPLLQHVFNSGSTSRRRDCHFTNTPCLSLRLY